MEVCRLLETEFPRQAKVSASQTFGSGSQDIEGLLKRLLRQIMQFQSEPVASQQSEQASEGVRLQCEETTEPDKLKRAAEAAAKLVELLGKIDRMNLGELQGMLEKSLRNNRYLLLIDDVWSKVAWNAIWSMLPSNGFGSRIIVTTRIDSVAKACSTTGDDYIHHMKALEEKESNQLFLSKAFGSTNEDSCPNDLKNAMKKILKKCGGLPLAIVSIAKLLASYTHPEGKKMWEIVGRSIGSQMESDPTLKGMRQILTLSYDHLPYHLKGCMMYLSIFPEDYVISKDRLLKRWIAEGMIPKKRGMTQMEVAEDYFNELLSRSMIDRGTDIVTMYHWREETCRVHDIILEVLVSKSLEFNFVSLIGGQYEGMLYGRIRRLTVHGGEAPQDSSPNRMAVYPGTRNDIKEMTLQHVRSLSIFDPEAHRLLARLGDFTLLRVLDLEDCKGLEEKHMRHICQMYLLRFLSLKGTAIKVMPSRIGDLEHLQTLDVRQTQLKCLPARIGDLKHLQTLDVRQTQLESLPETVTKLEKLEYLLFSTKGNNWSGWMLPKGIRKMKALRHVNKAVVIHDPNVAKEIGELDQLEELCIYVDTRENIHEDVPIELACSLSKIYSLQWLEIGNFACYKWPFQQALQFLHDVQQPPQLLRYLRICGCIEKLPDWVGSLINLIELDISWSYLHGKQLFSVLCKLPNLQRLTLGSYFIRKNQDMVACNSQSFPELKELTLGYSPEVPPNYIFEEGCMPKLETLVLNFGDQGKTIVGIEHLTNLREVQIDNCIKDSLATSLEIFKVENEKRSHVPGSEQIRVIVR
ncbi:disease resistance protein Pik-2-like [Triticum dicoccoides]|uniref:disease resistance protein Pik-2-like n=1 Tax=Triticum dicoccoides TaxID=85692 RepID=UPI00188DDEA1|nr:disease resistance protein Pik-2-like [Triticum dicoccoides]